MLITGQVIGRGQAARASGLAIPYQLVVPAKTLENLATIAAEAKRWYVTVQQFDQLSTQGHLPREVYKRAKFAEEVMAVVGDNLRIGVCCTVVCQALSGEIIGLAVYGWISAAEAALNLQVIEPKHLAGSPGLDQARGIGTALVAAISRQVLTRNGTSIYLHPLDSKAAEFWYHRGFRMCGAGGLMCVRGTPAVQQLLGSCTLTPDCPDQGQCVECGIATATARFAVPAG